MKANSQTFMFGPLCARSNTTTMQSLFWPMQSLFWPMLSWPCKKSEPGNGNIFWLWKDKGWIVETISLDSINDHFLCMITTEIQISNFKNRLTLLSITIQVTYHSILFNLRQIQHELHCTKIIRMKKVYA